MDKLLSLVYAFSTEYEVPLEIYKKLKKEQIDLIFFFFRYETAVV